MKDSSKLHEGVLKLTQSNVELYNRWENQIALHMEKDWGDSFKLAKQVSGSENPSIFEVAAMGNIKPSDYDKFLDQLNGVFYTLAKCCPLDDEGNWC